MAIGSVNMKQANGVGLRLLILLIAIGTLSVAAIACGSDGGGGASSSFDGPIAKIDDTDRIFGTQDLIDAGFKKSKIYDVSELPDATGAMYGFYGLDPYSRLEYEARFYPSHAEAIVAGIDYADEVVGADAVLLSTVQRWTEGIRERRKCAGGGGHQVGTCAGAKYFDYIIVGNMVLLCEGRDPVDSIQACADLMAVVR